jgi:hypothetical protein
MVNFREILGLDNIVVKITFGFTLVMIMISIILWLFGSGGCNK